MTTASRMKTTTFLSEALSFVMAGLLILWLAATPHPAPQPGNECRVDVAPVGSEVFLLPCSKVEPSVYPMVWFWEGQDV